jgi:hypothetical protein
MIVFKYLKLNIKPPKSITEMRNVRKYNIERAFLTGSTHTNSESFFPTMQNQM